MRTDQELQGATYYSQGYVEALSDIMNIINKNKTPEGIIKVAEFCSKKVKKEVQIIRDINKELQIKTTTGDIS